MIITNVTSTPSDYLVVKLETNNIAALNAQIAADAQTKAATDAQLDASDAALTDIQTMRAALDRRIEQDLASGILTETDATAVRIMLDQIDAQATSTAQASAAQIDDANQADAASATQTSRSSETQSSSSSTATDDATARTILTEQVSINGPLKTTVTIYSDGTRDTVTTVANQYDVQKYDRQALDEEAANAAAMRYLSTIEAGTLFTQMA